LIQKFLSSPLTTPIWGVTMASIITCIKCSQELRIPAGRQALKLKCPSCSTLFEWLNPELNIDSTTSVGEFAGQSIGSVGSAMNFADNVIFNAERGHGFAGERANHLHDVFTGKDASIVGSDNAKNGADRLVDGIHIQTKYCKTGSKCVSEAFEDGKYRYLNNDGSPMQLEVPSDKYDDAVKAMEERIKRGQVKNVIDPGKAKEIVRKGSYTYEQARNIARFGTIESITYDAANGIKIASSAMGISAAISFAIQLWSGKDLDVALKSACYDGFKVGGIAWVGSILTAQVGRTGIEQSLRGTTDWVVQQMGHKAAAWLANGLRSGSNIYGAAAANYVSKLLRGNIVTGVVTTIVLSSADFVRLFNGRVSGAQVFKNVTTTAAGVAGGTGGWMGGAAAGAAIGSAIPIIGTATAGIIGGILGSIAGGSAASAVASGVLDNFIEDDAKEMLRILESVFGDLAFDYLLNEREAQTVIEEIQAMDLPDFLRDMYASSCRQDFVKNKVEPMIEQIAKNRKIIHLPSDKQLITATSNFIEELMDNAQPA
jgi:phage FluMu protein Com